MNPMLNIAIRAARKAGNIIAKGYEQSPQDTQVSQKIQMIMSQKLIKSQKLQLLM